MNGQPEIQQTPQSIEERVERLEIRKLRAETRLIEAGMRHARFRLVLDIVKGSAITAAVMLATIAAKHAGLI